MDCSQCRGLCKHVAIETDNPEDKEDYANILCIYYTRINSFCGREYDSESYVKNGDGEAHDIIFRNAEEFLDYLKKNGLEYQKD